MARHSDVYKTKEWKEARQYVLTRSNGLCERCKKKGKIVPGKIVHHKRWLTDKNKHDWDIAYNPDNLEYICNDCHEEEHDRSIGLQKFLVPPP
ncbi:MAG: HNH endonuclease signature motif containing protein [Bacillota bacterium]|nr:HNH endonuclease signature motif containing protein [Bacillota bacterium]